MIDPGKVAAILLAAGRSERFGPSDKLMAEIDGTPLAARAAQPILEVPFGRRAAVCRAEGDAAARLLRRLGFEIVVNPHPERGISESLRYGIADARSSSFEAALICLADMPHVTGSHLRALLARFDPHACPIVASQKGPVPMPPAIFASSEYDRLMLSRGDHGAKAMLSGAALVPASDRALADVDHMEDIDGNGSDF